MLQHLQAWAEDFLNAGKQYKVITLGSRLKTSLVMIAKKVQTFLFFLCKHITA